MGKVMHEGLLPIHKGEGCERGPKRCRLTYCKTMLLFVLRKKLEGKGEKSYHEDHDRIY